MIESDYYVKDLIDSVKVETDSYQEVPQNLILMAYNSLMQQLYRTVIREQASAEISRTYSEKVYVTQITEDDIGGNQATVKPEDILKVEMGAIVFSRATQATANSLKNIYYKWDGGQIKVSCAEGIKGDVTFKVTYIEKPKLATTENYSTTHIPVPNEFVPMVYAGVRGEAYKLANQDTLSAKWIADYNAQAETLAKWIAETKPTYGN